MEKTMYVNKIMKSSNPNNLIGKRSGTAGVYIDVTKKSHTHKQFTS
jgi:hypothetical protein